MKVAGVILLILSLAGGVAGGEEIYTHVDAQGVLHLTNVPKDPLYQPKGSLVFFPKSKYTENYKDIIKEAADKHQVDPQLIHAVIKVESDYQQFARSTKGAMGLMQLMPQTAVDLQVKNPYDPQENVHGGTKYLRFLLDLFKGDLELSLAGYNAGENAVLRYGKIPPYYETQNYVRKVLELYSPTYLHLPRQPGTQAAIGSASEGNKIYISVNPQGTVSFSNLPPLQVKGK
jgi:soluble lytic murein transglycosylase